MIIYKLTVVTQLGVNTYRIGDVIPDNGKKINLIQFNHTDKDIIYQVFDAKSKIIAEIINCPVEVIYL